MEILSDNTDILNPKGCIVTIGNFDGIHIGHSEIINLANKLAKNQKTQSVLITFNPHPAEVLGMRCENYLITNFEEKMKLLSKSGLDFVYVVEFNPEFSTMEAEDFIKDFIYEKFRPSDIIIGYDHFFGKDRKGSYELLKQYQKELSYQVHKVSKVELNNIDIKSSKIRDFIMRGEIVEANSLLGRNFSISGTVIKGRGVGKKLSFPTANIHISNPAQLIPGNGVYHIDLFIKKDNKTYNSVCNIGIRPTFNDEEDAVTIEAHILSEGEFNIYNHDVDLIFKEYIRAEMKFNDEKELINQINLDKEYCINS